MDEIKQDKNNKKLFWIAGIFGAVMVIVAAILVSLMLTAPEETEADPSSPTSEEDKHLDTSLVPEVTAKDFTRSGADTFATLTFETGDPGKELVTEYRIEDSGKNTLDEGVVDETNKVSAKILLENGDNAVTIKLRVSSHFGYSTWVAADTASLEVADLAEAEGQNTLAEPNAAYFDTPWSDGNVELTLENAQVAIQSAWGATPATSNDSCMMLNSNAIRVGEMIPPIPSIIPEEYQLKYDAWITGDTVELTYYWCEIPGYQY